MDCHRRLAGMWYHQVLVYRWGDGLWKSPLGSGWGRIGGIARGAGVGVERRAGSSGPVSGVAGDADCGDGGPAGRDGSGKIRWWLVEAGAAVKSGQERTQTLTLTLTPLLCDEAGRPVPLDVDAAQPVPGA